VHELLHTHYKNRKRISGEEIVLSKKEQVSKLNLNICFGTSCFIRGAQDLYTKLMDYVKSRGIADETEFKVSFCREQCKKGPNLSVNGVNIEHCTIEKAIAEIEKII
jgi:NADH:ubiquinone oxidoreductase subunit E